MRTINALLFGIIALFMTSSIHANTQSTDQGSFVVQTYGKGNTTLILIPGLMSNGSVFDELAKRLSAQHTVHVISVKGFAGTPKSKDFSIDSLCADIAQYIQREGIQQPTIIGHSMGGLTAFMLASKHEDIVGKIISIDGLPFIGPVFTRNNATTVSMITPQAIGIKTMFANMSAQQLAFQTQQSISIQAKSADDQARIVDMAKRSDPTNAGQAMFDVMTTDLRQAITRTNTPMLMLGASGGFSQASEHEHIAKLYEAQFKHVKNATVKMNSKVKHFMMFDDVDWVNTNINAFINQ